MMKREHGNDQEQHPPAGQGLPPPFPMDDKSAKPIVQRILQQDYGLKPVDRISNEHHIGVNVNSPNSEYEYIAPHVDLQSAACMRDISTGTFPLHRSPIPTSLFKSIVEDMDLLMVQYGPPERHRTEGVTSRLISPIFDRLVAEFRGSVRNCPEKNMSGSITTQGRIKHHFMAFGSVSILCVEAKLCTGSLDERLDAVAQVIAECEGKASLKLRLAINNHDCQACHNRNKTQGSFMPVHGILFDGKSFQFFLFEGHATTSFSFKRGTIAGKQSLPFQFPISVESCQPFLAELRQICEITFDLLLSSFISDLDAYYTCKEQKSIPSTTEWEKALIVARVAQEKFRDADLERQNPDQSSATTSVTDAMKVFYRSIELIPEIFKTKSMLDSWNDEAVEET